MDVKIKLLTLFYSDKFKPVVHMGTAAFTIQTLRLMLAVLEEIRWTQGKLLSLNHHKCSVVVDTEKDVSPSSFNILPSKQKININGMH